MTLAVPETSVKPGHPTLKMVSFPNFAQILFGLILTFPSSQRHYISRADFGVRSSKSILGFLIKSCF